MSGCFREGDVIMCQFNYTNYNNAQLTSKLFTIILNLYTIIGHSDMMSSVYTNECNHITVVFLGDYWFTQIFIETTMYYL